MSYTLTPAEYRGLKSRLTRAIKAGKPGPIIEACDHARAVFEEKGYPDDWSRWERAKEDAAYKALRDPW